MLDPILCLHGYHGSSGVLRQQMRELVAKLPFRLDFHCIDAPSLGVGDHGWWHARRSAAGPSLESNVSYDGWARSKDHVCRLVSEKRYSGILGFSQGAAMTSLVVGLADLDGAFDFAIMIGGFRSADPLHAELYANEKGYRIPSLHIVGEADTIVRPSLSIELASQFHHPNLIMHRGGHVVPHDAASVKGVAAFLQERSNYSGKHGTNNS